MDWITKFVIAAVAAAAGSMGGLFFSKRLKTRAGYYRALTGFISHILSEVKFRKNPLKTIVSDYIKLGETPLNKNLSEYLNAADPKNLSLTKGSLKTAELAEVKNFLSSLGALDSATQVCELEAYKEKFSALALHTAQVRDKHSSMYVKLGFFIGLAAGILVL